jgi:8-oxo-dGTP pyrophosphatase MutT (NUDIX family)
MSKSFCESYLGKVRALIGSQMILIPGGRALLENSNGELLLHRREDNKQWAIPGGACDYNESIEAAVIREIYEETGLTITTYKAIGFASNPEFEINTYPNGDIIHGFGLVLYSNKWCGQLGSNCDESIEFGWFSRDELPPLHLRDLRTIEALNKYLRSGEFQLF